MKVNSTLTSLDLGSERRREKRIEGKKRRIEDKQGI